MDTCQLESNLCREWGCISCTPIPYGRVLKFIFFWWPCPVPGATGPVLRRKTRLKIVVSFRTLAIFLRGLCAPQCKISMLVRCSWLSVCLIFSWCVCFKVRYFWMPLRWPTCWRRFQLCQSTAWRPSVSSVYVVSCCTLYIGPNPLWSIPDCNTLCLLPWC